MQLNDLQSPYIERGIRVVSCLPFRKKFYEAIWDGGMSGKDLVNKSDWDKYVFVPFGEKRAEAHFEWMIKNGIARREVDGQGLTNRVRLTFLGRTVIDHWIGEVGRAGLRDRIFENFRRHSLMN